MHSKQKSCLKIKKHLILCTLITTFFCVTSLNAVEEDLSVSIVQSIIKVFKTNNKNKIASFISFPFQRHYPIAPINNEEEFVERFDEIFDDFLINAIINSDIKKDWVRVGWTGIMFSNGQLWLHYNGKISAVNYQTEHERKQQEKIMTGEFIDLNASSLEQTILEFKTEHHRIRIDYLGKDLYRYMSWSLYRALHQNPEFIIENGIREFDGSGGNHHYIFKKDNYVFRCSVFVVGHNISSSEVFVDIFKDGEILFTEKAVVIVTH